MQQQQGNPREERRTPFPPKRDGSSGAGTGGTGGSNSGTGTREGGKDGRDQRHHSRRDQYPNLAKKLVVLRRVSKVVSGGKNFGFTVSVVVGDGNGKVGFGEARAKDPHTAFNKCVNKAQEKMIYIPMDTKKSSFLYEVETKFCATTILMKKGRQGTGLKCCTTIESVLTCAGIKNAVCSVRGSNNKINVLKGTFQGIQQMIGTYRLLRSKVRLSKKLEKKVKKD